MDGKFKGTSDNYQFVTPAPYQVRDKLRRESSGVGGFWIPAFAGTTFLLGALNTFKFFLKVFNLERFNEIWKIAKKVSGPYFCIGPIP